jgi:hypothetical protein
LRDTEFFCPPGAALIFHFQSGAYQSAYNGTNWRAADADAFRASVPIF